MLSLATRLLAVVLLTVFIIAIFSRGPSRCQAVFSMHELMSCSNDLHGAQTLNSHWFTAANVGIKRGDPVFGVSIALHEELDSAPDAIHIRPPPPPISLALPNTGSLSPLSAMLRAAPWHLQMLNDHLLG